MQLIDVGLLDKDLAANDPIAMRSRDFVGAPDRSRTWLSIPFRKLMPRRRSRNLRGTHTCRSTIRMTAATRERTRCAACWRIKESGARSGGILRLPMCTTIQRPSRNFLSITASVSKHQATLTARLHSSCGAGTSRQSFESKHFSA